MAAASGDKHRDGVFLPRGAVHLLGPQTYANVLQENEVFLNNVATIPVNLEYAAWFAVIDPTNQSENEPISLHEHLLRKSWFIRIKPIARKKCLLVTTHSTLNDACIWIDEHLEKLVRKSIPPGIDPPSSLLPRRLDKPMNTKIGLSYADILKKQFSLAPNPATNETRNNHPPRKRQAAIIDYDSDTPSEMTQTTINADNTTSNAATTSSTSTVATNNNSTIPATPSPALATDMVSIKHELNQLKEAFATAVAEIKNAIATLLQDKHNTMVYDTPIEADQMDTAQPVEQLTQMDIQSFITDLKNELATFFIETRAVIQQQPTATLSNHHKPPKT